MRGGRPAVERAGLPWLAGVLSVAGRHVAPCGQGGLAMDGRCGCGDVEQH